MLELKTFLFATAAALALPMPAFADDGAGAKKTDKTEKTAPAPVSDSERTEVMHRHHVNVMEIQMGKLAAKRGGDAVKKYGTMLVTDHTRADKDVVALAKKKGITLTEHPMEGVEAAKHQEQMELMARLETLSGTAFDDAYLTAMVDGHEGEIARVSAALPSTTDAQVRALLEKTLPSLRKQAAAARTLQG